MCVTCSLVQDMKKNIKSIMIKGPEKKGLQKRPSFNSVYEQILRHPLRITE